MKNIFAQTKDYVEGRKRNTFDLSFQNNLTMEMGKLYPVMCKEVLPGDSFRIKPTFGLRFMPLAFPVQTRMQANLHFFYVRNRNLWKDWPDFIGRTKSNLVPPFLAPSVAARLAKTRALGDYFGLPTTLSGDFGSVARYRGTSVVAELTPGQTDDYRLYAPVVSTESSGVETLAFAAAKMRLAVADGTVTDVALLPHSQLDFATMADVGDGLPSDFVDSSVTIDGASYTRNWNRNAVWFGVPMSRQHFTWLMNNISTATADPGSFACYVIVPPGEDNPTGGSILYKGIYASSSYVVDYDNTKTSVTSDSWFCVWKDGVLWIPTLKKDVKGGSTPGSGQINQRIVYKSSVGSYVSTSNLTGSAFVTTYNQLSGEEIAYGDDAFGQMRFTFGFGLSATLLQKEDCPFTGNTVNFLSNEYVGPDSIIYHFHREDSTEIPTEFNPYSDGTLKISALPFRAYESIYNCFYRNQQNDPFVLNGVEEYNKWITTNEGGEDSTDYDFFYRNWEMDFLTSATQSPQQGDITPLVGVSSTGDFTFQNSDGTQYTVHPVIGEDGNTLTGIDSYDGTPENNSGIRRLMDMISYGISINDFRNVNALQRWLETNLRRGYRYRDQIKSHFDVDVHYNELDMPEFIGGMSEPVIIDKINQAVDLSSLTGSQGFNDVLGSYAGQASILAQSQHDVSQYCDEHGFIIGILSVSPVPNYSQLLPKMFIKDNVLDYYFPEFGHIGNQPITYREVCPLQMYAAMASDDSLNFDKVFGYQRAWYDLIQSVDEVHGDFRLSLRDYLVNRVFNGIPELGHDFLFVDPDQINDIFSVAESDNEDHILGQVYFDISCQREIPKFGIPRLE